MVVATTERASSEVVLPDGLRVIVRGVVPSDEGPIREFLEGLSVHSRYRRFFSLSPDLARWARSAASSEPDRYGLVACPPGTACVVGHAGYWRMREGRADLALAVADGYQGHGLGRVLLRRVADEAETRRVKVLCMDVLPSNLPGLALLAGCGRPLRVEALQGVLMCELLLVPGNGS